MVRRLLRPALAIIAGVGLLAAAPAGAVRGFATDQTILVGVVDAAGHAVRGLGPADFHIREDGNDREVTSAEPSTQPLQMVLLVDTTKAVVDMTQDIRKQLGGFIRSIHQQAPDADIELIEFGQAARIVTPFSRDDEGLQRGIDAMVGRPDAASVLAEGIIRASDELSKRPSHRRVIVVFNTEPSNEQSREQPKKITEALGTSIAQLWVVSLQRGALNNPKRDVVLEALAKNTGGAREYIYNQAAIEKTLEWLSEGFTFQYEVTYRRPEGQHPTQVQVGMAPGWRIHASGFANR